MGGGEGKIGAGEFGTRNFLRAGYCGIVLGYGGSFTE